MQDWAVQDLIIVITLVPKLAKGEPLETIGDKCKYSMVRYFSVGTGVQIRLLGVTLIMVRPSCEAIMSICDGECDLIAALRRNREIMFDIKAHLPVPP